MITSPAFAGKRYAVLGLARTGLATVRALLASGAEVTAWDSREEPRGAIVAEFGDRITLADPVTADLSSYAGIIVSPGVPLNRHPIAEVAQRQNVPLIGDIEIFSQARPSLPDHCVVGITGTNGKSTTTALIHHLLQCAGVPSLMGGNIGLPILGQEPLMPNAHGPGVYVLELSSYQIDITQRLDCDVALLLNLSPDHLDRYGSYEAYIASKTRLFGMQAIGHLAIIDHRAEIDENVLRHAPDGQPFQFIDGVSIPGDQADWPSLQGPHNRANAAAAVATVRHLGVSDEVIAAGLKTFHGLPHRMERVAKASGVIFINDSKATNPASTAPALAAFPPVAAEGGAHRRIHWICGGLPKGDDLDDCAPFFGNIAAAYTIGEAGPRFADLLEPSMEVHRSEMMCEAIRQAIDAAAPGDVVLLSPACASFDQFRDYEARGDAFRQLVGALLDEGHC